MRKRIYIRLIVMSVLTMAIISLILTYALYSFLSNQVAADMRVATLYLSQAVENAEVPNAVLESARNMDLSRRITLVMPDGSVIYDSDREAATLENHIEREEIKQALETGSGESWRHSSTQGEQTLYCAVRLSNGSVLRLSESQKTITGMLGELAGAFIAAIAAAAIVALILARQMTRSIIEPIESLNIAQPEQNDTYEELTPLLTRLHRQQLTLNEQLTTLREQKSELEAITENMREGLVLLDSKQYLLSINRSARQLFAATDAMIGQSALVLNRGSSFADVISCAAHDKPGETQLTLNGRIYALYISPVPEQRGSVLLIQDVTERLSAEQMRRTFTANVSHELKTPLTSICGYAEIMQNGIAKPEDLPEFAGRIHSEAVRLLRLIEDILRLSHLDESKSAELTPLNLADATNNVVERLRERAEVAGVTLNTECNGVSILGEPGLLDELIYNLVDNAIKYNHANGNVDIAVILKNGLPRLIVRDNGIGIPKSEQGKVFERFYRVDKSRQRRETNGKANGTLRTADDVGGTGLGLSIVRHAALLLKADVELDSTETVGTKVTVTFEPDRGQDCR